MKLGGRIYRFRWWVVAAWTLAAILLIALTPEIDPSLNERDQFLPEDTDYVRAVRVWEQSFPRDGALSRAILVFERSTGALTDSDRDAIERIASRIRRGDLPLLEPGDMEKVNVVSPGSIGVPTMPGLGTPLVPNPQLSPVSPRGQAAVVHVHLPSNFISIRADRMVRAIRAMLREETLPEGLSVAVTGTAGFGHDYAHAANRSHELTSKVTLICVVVILLIVYRAPLAAMVPLVSVGLASVVVLKLLGVAEAFGMHTGTAERIFVFVLMYGAGIDYCLLLVSRYRECLQDALDHKDASARALNASFPAIFASAGTDTAGLLMLSFGQFAIFATTGPAVGLALMVAMLASITLVPALVSIVGPRMFWPVRAGLWTDGRAKDALDRRWFWPRVARFVTRRPALVIALTILVFVAPAIQGARIPWLYDALSGFRAETDNNIGNAAKGVEIAHRHWPAGDIAASNVMVQLDEPLTRERWVTVSQQLTAALRDLPGVSNVRSLSAPYGRNATPFQNLMVRKLGFDKAVTTYLGKAQKTARLEVVLSMPPLGNEALQQIPAIREKTQNALRAMRLAGEVYISGATAETLDTRRVTQKDFLLIASLTLGVIFVIVLILLRDAILSGFMIASTVLSYLATLGIAYWAMSWWFGSGGLDWKVEIFLFVVMVAVGQDYNIFLAARLAEEARTLDPVRATRRAVVHTGPVISSCGIIMAATLGSLMVGELVLMIELGFALALGMLIDTFVVRPLMLPAFVVLTRRTGRGGKFS